VEKFINTD